MKCETIFKDASFHAELFCRSCGMDIGFNPVKTHHRGEIELYCCEDCAKIR